MLSRLNHTVEALLRLQIWDVILLRSFSRGPILIRQSKKKEAILNFSVYMGITSYITDCNLAIYFI